MTNMTANTPRRKGLRRLWPDTLFGQLVLTFSLGFFVLLVLVSLHLSATRHFFMLRWLMSDRSRQLSNVALLLDSADTESRQRLIERLRIPGFTLTLADHPPEMPKPVGDTREQRELEEDSELLGRILQRIFDGTLGFPDRAPEGAGLGYGDRESLADKDKMGRSTHDFDDDDDGVPPPWAEDHKGSTLSPRIRATVLQTSLPDPSDDLFAPIIRLFQPKPSGQKPTAYRAMGGVQLTDGTWMVFEDSVPGYRASSFPFTGIVLMEAFFVLISLLAFLLIVRPLRRLARAADSFGRDMPGTPPLPESGPREVREAAQAFNRMQQRIREFVDERSRTLAAVSHDLRTPLTRLRLRVEQLDDEPRQLLQKDMDELQSLMDTTIDLARGSSETCARVDVAALLESLVEDRQDMGQNVVLVESDSLRKAQPIMARPLSVKRCLANLMDNAIRYGGLPAHGDHAAQASKVEVMVEDGPDDLIIAIRDYGPGIPTEHLQRVFEPFFRLEPSRNRGTGGNGLGLSIARSMARMHGGDITLSNVSEAHGPDAEPGHVSGLVARLSLPRHN